MPAIQQVYDKYRGQGLTVLAADLQEGEALVAMLGIVWYLYRRHFMVISGPVIETANEVEPH